MTAAQASAEHLACSIASAEAGISRARELRRCADVARSAAKARADDMRGLSAERILADLQWRDLTVGMIDMHLEELQLQEKLERIRGESIATAEDEDMTIPPPDPVAQAIKDYWAWHATLPLRLGDAPLDTITPSRRSWWRLACGWAGAVLVAAGDWLIERECR